MKIKNTSDSNLNLESGIVEPGKTGDATKKEYAFLRGIERCEIYKAPVKKSGSSGGLGDK